MSTEPNPMDPRTATREKYLVMKGRATKAALILQTSDDPEQRDLSHGIGNWASEWVEEWEAAHPGQAEPSST